MNNLKLSVFGKSFGICRRPCRVPTIVIGKFTSQVRWRLAGEWSKVLDTIMTIPRAPEAAAFPSNLPHGDSPLPLWVVDENSMTPFKGTTLLAKVDDGVVVAMLYVLSRGWSDSLLVLVSLARR
ncbi:unnamed protein product [Dovyalis caffra]|uniref:Uncharacterized protein n=1 Tax=Dovyalis caffra TaxID=77055 RepID=A0AAV1SCC3_9ROSI|nr:unnamed protein product [Dovyalis caffra]